MIIPDCRLDKDYNEDFLNDRDREFIIGYDYCMEQIENLFIGNLDVYAGRLEVDTEVDVDKFLDKAKEEIVEMIEDWYEGQRNEMITSMIDNMDDDEYETKKAEALERNKKRPEPKKYIDTRSYR